MQINEVEWFDLARKWICNLGNIIGLNEVTVAVYHFLPDLNFQHRDPTFHKSLYHICEKDLQEIFYLFN